MTLLRRRPMECCTCDDVDCIKIKYDEFFYSSAIAIILRDLKIIAFVRGRHHQCCNLTTIASPPQ